MTAVGSNSDARKRRQESVPADETVRVPAALVEALREALGHRKAADFSARFHRESLFTAARALVDAAERPDEGKPLCKCGHDHQWSSGTIWSAQGTVCGRCPCTAFTPAPLSSPRRTRDEGSEDEAAWQAYARDVLKTTVPEAFPSTRTGFIAGFRAARAARLDELEHEVEGLAWRNQQLTERLEKNHD